MNKKNKSKTQYLHYRYNCNLLKIYFKHSEIQIRNTVTTAKIFFLILKFLHLITNRKKIMDWDHNYALSRHIRKFSKITRDLILYYVFIFTCIF